MATSSIFQTPQFNTEESVRSLVEAIEATMSDKVNHRVHVQQARQVKDLQEIRRLLDCAK